MGKYCKQCGTELHEEQAICVKCGVKVGSGNNYCHYCGKEVTPEQEYCLNCGVSLKQKKFNEQIKAAASGDEYNGYSKLVMALVCFFLGGIGIHNFMMGETKKGIVKIILCFACGISEIFALIDFIKILVDKYEIDPEKVF